MDSETADGEWVAEVRNISGAEKRTRISDRKSTLREGQVDAHLSAHSSRHSADAYEDANTLEQAEADRKKHQQDLEQNEAAAERDQKRQEEKESCRERGESASDTGDKSNAEMTPAATTCSAKEMLLAF